MPIYSGKSGPCHWAFVVGELDDVDFERFLERLRDIGRNGDAGDVILDLLDTPLPGAVRRKKISDVVVAFPNLDRIAGHAIVTRNQMVRGLMTALNWVIRPAFEEKLFASPVEALQWLQERNSDVDAKKVWADIQAACPELGPVVW